MLRPLINKSSSSKLANASTLQHALLGHSNVYGKQAAPVDMITYYVSLRQIHIGCVPLGVAKIRSRTQRQSHQPQPLSRY